MMSFCPSQVHILVSSWGPNTRVMSAGEFAGVVHDKRFTLEVLCLQNALRVLTDPNGEHEATKPNFAHLIHVQLDLFDLSIPWQSRIPTLESHVCLVLVSRSQGRFCPNSSPSAKCKASSPHSLEHCKMLKCVSHLWMRFYSPPGDTHRLENSLGAHWQKSLMMMCHLTTLKTTPGLTLPAHDPASVLAYGTANSTRINKNATTCHRCIFAAGQIFQNRPANPGLDWKDPLRP